LEKESEIRSLQIGRGDIILYELKDDEQVGFTLDAMSLTKGLTFIMFRNDRLVRLLLRYGFTLVCFNDDGRLRYYDRRIGFYLKCWGGQTIVNPAPMIMTEAKHVTAGEGSDELRRAYSKVFYGGNETLLPVGLVLDRESIHKLFDWFSLRVLKSAMHGTLASKDTSENSEVSSALHYYSQLLFCGSVTSDGASIQEMVQRCMTSIDVNGMSLTTPLDMSYRDGIPYKWLDYDYDSGYDGQMKLLTSDMGFCVRYRVRRPLVIGGSPGEHWKYLPMIRPVLMDPRKPPFEIEFIQLMAEDADQILHIMRHYECDGVIWDVRDEVTAEEIAKDNELLFNILNVVSENYNTSAKFKFPTKGVQHYVIRNYKAIQPQAYKRMHSFESRLEQGPGGSLKVLSDGHFRGWCSWINETIAAIGNRPVADAILNRIERFNYNVPRHVEGARVAIQTLGLNGYSYDEFLIKCRQYDLFTTLNSVGSWGWPQHIRLNRDTYQIFGWKDRSYDIYKLQTDLSDYYMFTVRDFVTLSCYVFDKYDMRSMRGPPVDLNSKAAQVSVIFIKRKIVENRLNVRTQNWLNAQTHLVKFTTTIWREVLKLENISLHYWRMWATIRRYPDAVLLEDQRVSAQLGNIMIAVAGHPLNMLLAAPNVPIDCVRYLNTIENNIREWRAGYLKSEVEMLKTGTNAEKVRMGLWHNYYEYILAVDTVKLLVKYNMIGFSYAINIFENFFNRPDIRSVTSESEVVRDVLSVRKPEVYKGTQQDLIHKCMEMVNSRPGNCES
jgi:hypothetical protein